MSIDSYLQGAQSDWESAGSIPDGDYPADIVILKFIEQKKGFSKEYKLIWEFRITGNGQVGEKVSMFNDLNGTYVKFTKANFKKMGHDLKTAVEVQSLVQKEVLSGKKVWITLSTKENYQRVYLKGLQTESDGNAPFSEFDGIKNFTKTAADSDLDPSFDFDEVPSL